MVLDNKIKVKVPVWDLLLGHVLGRVLGVPWSHCLLRLQPKPPAQSSRQMVKHSRASERVLVLARAGERNHLGTGAVA